MGILLLLSGSLRKTTLLNKYFYNKKNKSNK